MIKLNPGQGQIYRIKDKSRIKIELVEPDDGPSKKARGISWKKLQPKAAGPKK